MSVSTGHINSAPERTARPKSSTWRGWVAYVLIALASIAMVVIHVPQHHSVSPVDEYVYIDYLYKVPSQFVVHRGEKVSQAAREYLVCNGVRAIGEYPEKLCRDQARTASEIDQLPNGGYTTADIYTPLYFAITWVVAQPLVALGVDLVDAARYTGAIWLALAGMLLYAALRRFSASPMLAFAGSLLTVCSLPAYWSNTYVSTDATGLFAGALLLYVLARGFTRLRDAVFLIAAASFVTLLKVQNLLAVGIVVVFLLVRVVVDVWSRGRGEKGRILGRIAADRRTRVAVATAGIPILLQVLWLWVRGMVAVGPSPDQGVSAPFSKSALLSETLKFLPHALEGAGATGSPLLDWIGAATSLVLAAAVIALALSARLGSVNESVGVATLVLAVVGGPALAIASAIGAGYYFVLPARYGIALVPAMVLCLVLVVRKKAWARSALIVVSAVVAGCVLVVPQIA